MKRVLILAGSFAAALLASDQRGTVTFHGMPVPGVVVSATQGDQKVVTSTDEVGSYTLRNLSEGNWTVAVEMSGFVKDSREISVGPGAPDPSWELKLAPPDAAPAPSGPAAPAGAPTPGPPTSPPRSPGAANAGGRGGPPMTPQQAQAAAKARSIAQLQAQDTMQSRAAAVAATTQSSGGDTLTLAGSLGGGGGSGVSFGNNLSGGSQYSGNASFSLDNSVWDANSYSISGIHTQKPAFAKGRINVSFGGPLRIPHLLSGKKSTFVLNYSMGRTRNGSTQNATVPTLLERGGDFSQSVIQGPVVVYDPANGAPFPGNKIPTSRISRAAQTMAGYYPQPNASGSRLNYQTSLVSISDQDNLNARLNHTIDKDNRISGGIGWQRTTGTSPNIFGFIDDTRYYGVNANAQWAHTYSKRAVQSVTVNFSRSRTETSPYFATLGTNIAQQLGIQGTSPLPQNYGVPNLGFTNFSGLGDANAMLSRNQTVNLGYSFNLTRARHQWTFGADYRRQQINPFSDANGRGSFTFTGAATSGPGNAGGYDFADFLLDYPSAANIRFGNADKYFRTWKLDGYASDNWQISKSLTANLGLRYDYTAPYTEIYNRLSNLSVGPNFGSVSVVTAGQSGFPTSLIKPDYNTVSPSLGLTWMPFMKKKIPTQVRLGFSQIHPLDAYSPIASNLSGQPPFARALSIGSSTANPLSMETAFLNSPPVANTYAIDPNYKLLSVTQTMLLVIQPLSKSLYVVAGFVEAQASHLDQDFLPNSLPPGVKTPPGWPTSGYIYEQSNARLHAQVGVFQVARQMGSGLSASANVQVARVIDNGSVIGMGNAGMAQNWQDLDAEKATSALVPKAQIGGNWQYSSGQGKAGGTLLRGWRGALLKDWTVTNGLTWRVGSPLTPIVLGNYSTAGGTGITGTVRADATGLPIGAPSGSDQPFNLAAFTTPINGQWGNAGRNVIPGPNIWSLNASLGRVFRLGERRSADLRFDANNFINHVVVNGWSTVVNAYNYGLPTGTQPMRSLTANLRVRF